MGRRFYPYSTIDRTFFWIGLVAAILAPAAWLWGPLLLAQIVTSIPIGSLAMYIWQDPPESTGAPDYSGILGEVANIAATLEGIRQFLDSERKRISEAELTIARLKADQQVLEPVVKTQRDTVNAILSAHARAQAQGLWKERALSFALGVLASMIAAVVHDLLRN